MWAVCTMSQRHKVNGLMGERDYAVKSDHMHPVSR